MDMSGPLFSRQTDHWSTPPDFYARLDAEFRFTLDPCPLRADFDGLRMDWGGRVFVNPPYSSVSRWVEKAAHEVAEGRAELVVLLVFAKTDTRWFHRWLYGQAELRFVPGRLKFGGAVHNAPAPSMVAILRTP